MRVFRGLARRRLRGDLIYSRTMMGGCPGSACVFHRNSIPLGLCFVLRKVIRLNDVGLGNGVAQDDCIAINRRFNRMRVFLHRSTCSNCTGTGGRISILRISRGFFNKEYREGYMRRDGIIFGILRVFTRGTRGYGHRVRILADKGLHRHMTTCLLRGYSPSCQIHLRVGERSLTMCLGAAEPSLSHVLVALRSRNVVHLISHGMVRVASCRVLRSRRWLVFYGGCFFSWSTS